MSALRSVSPRFDDNCGTPWRHAAYVQVLFEDEGVTFSQFLIGERLERVNRMLRDPLQMEFPISAIAYDLASAIFAFQPRLGVASARPSDVRANGKARAQ